MWPWTLVASETRTPAAKSIPRSTPMRPLLTDPPEPRSTTASTRNLSRNGLAWLRTATSTTNPAVNR